MGLYAISVFVVNQTTETEKTSKYFSEVTYFSEIKSYLNLLNTYKIVCLDRMSMLKYCRKKDSLEAIVVLTYCLLMYSVRFSAIRLIL